MEINAFQGTGGSVGLRSEYFIRLKAQQFQQGDSVEQRLILYSDRPVVGAYPAFMRFRMKRNGTWREDEQTHRPKLRKWFAMQIPNIPEDFGYHDCVPYKDSSYLRLHEIDEYATMGIRAYDIKAISDPHHQYGNGVPVTQWIWNKFCRFSTEYEEWVCDIRRPYGSRFSDHYGILGFKHCGIALVNERGTVVSNICRMRVVISQYYDFGYLQSNYEEFHFNQEDLGHRVFLYPMIE